MFKRILALFLSFVMVFSLLPVSAFAEENSGETPVTEGEQTEVNETEAPATEQTSATEESTEATESPEPGMTVISGTIPTQVNPRYAGLVSVEDIPAAEPVMLMTEPEYGTIAEAKAAIREGMKARAPQVVVYIQTVAQDFDALYTELFEGALAHTGMSTEGDYLAYQFGSYGGGYNGQYDDLGNYYMTYQFDFTYYDTAEQQAAMDSAVTSLLNQLNLYGKSDYEKICGIYDWMCANITYDNVNLNNESYVLKYTAYAALINRTSVCQGYANLFYRLALALGVDSRIIAGIGITDSGNGPHAWNVVKLNGSYYDMDATWDATWKQAGLAYEWFLKNEEDFSADHVRNAEYSTTAFNTSYPMATEDFDPIVASGTCGANLTWTLDYEGTLTISGTGAMAGYTEETSVPWYSYRESVKKVIVESGVTSIGDVAFCLCDSLTAVTIPNSVASIGYFAFSGCDSLTEVMIPDSVTRIDHSAFAECTDLRAVSIGNAVVSIGDYAFVSCSSLTEVTIPDSVTSIGESAFSGCSSLTKVTIPNTVTSIAGSAFSDCSSLTEVTIPDSVTWIGYLTFVDCDSLIKIIVEEDNPNYSSDQRGILFNKDKTTLIQAPGGISDTYIVPDSISSIGDCAFYACKNLTTVTIPDSVTSIGVESFAACEGLTEVTIPESVTSIDICAFNNCINLTRITFEGDAPTFGSNVFSSVKATAYYPANNETWTADVMQNYGGTITWVAYTPEATVVSVTTEEELLDALADGEKAITIAADMEIGDDLQLQGTALEVAEDVTLTLNGGLNIGSGSSVTVSGELISNKGITVEGALTVENSLESNAPFWIVEGGEVIVNGTLNSNDVFHIGFGEKDAISSLSVSGTLNNYNYFNITAKGEVNVAGTFNNTGNAMSFGFVENHGTMTVSGTLNNETFLGISLDGVLNITGTYVSDGPIAVNAFNHDVQLSGVGAAADIRYCCNVNSLETLKAAVAEADNYGYLYIDICGSFDIGEEITFPANTEVHLYGQPENSVELRVLSAGRLTNLGKFYVEDFATLQIDEGAVYCNNADTVVCGGIVNVDGEYTSDNGKNTVEVDIFRGGSVSGVDAACNESAETFEELQSLLIAAKGMQFVQVRIEVRSTITLKNGLNVPPNVRLQIIGDPGNEVELIIPSGTSLSNHGTVEMNCGKLNIHSNGNVYNYGEFAFNAQPHGFGGGTIAGDFRNEGVLWINTGSSVTVAEGANLYNGKTLHVGFGENVCKLTVDGTVINTGYLNLEALGEMSVSGMMHNTNTQNSSGFVDLKGKLTVSGTLNNYSTIGVRGTLDIPGEVDNGGNMTVDGGRLNVTTYSGSGQITRLINVEGTSLTVPDNVFNVRYLYRVASLDELKAAIEEAFNYEWMEADVIAPITLDADMEIPGGMGLNLCQVENQSVTLTVPAGMELTNRGSIAIHSTAKLDIQSGAALNNDSTINVQGGTLNNEGTYDPMDYGKINISMEDGGTVNNAPAQVYGLVFDMAGLKAALEAVKDLETDAVLEICGNVTVDTDLEIPANVTALIVGGPGMNLTVASGVTLVNNGCIEINGMASLVNDGALTNNGSMTVHPNCTFQDNGTFTGNKPIVYVDYGHVNVSTEAELIAGLNNENIWSMTITDSIRLTKNISIPEKGIYIDEGLSITVPEGVELNLNGGYIGIRNGNLLVEAGGLLINNGDIDVVRGELSVAADDGYQGDGQILQYLGRAVVSVPEGANLSYNAIAESAEELELILAAAEDMEWLDVQLFGGFAITDDLVIPANIGISMDGVDGEPAEYTVSGATLTSNGHIYVGEDAALVIEEDATLCNEGGIYVAGLLDMAGTYISESDNVVQVNLLTGVANGVDFYYHSGTEEFEVLQELLQLAAQTELDVVIDISYAMDITEDIVIPENVSLELCNGSETVVNICESVTVTNNGRIAVLMGASLVNQGTVNNLGTLEIDSDSYLVDSGIIEGNPPVYGSAAGNTQVYTEEELLEALYDDSVDCVTLCAPVTLSGDLYVPDWKGIDIISEAALTVPDGKALYLGYGTMLTIAEGGSVLVSEGATLSNSGSIAVNGGSLIVNGEYVSEGELVVNLSFASSTVDGVDAQWVSYQISVENMAELKEAAEAAARMDNTCMIQMFTPFDITEDITISANTIVDVCLYDAENHSFLVAENVTIENFGSIRMNGMSDMSVLSGAEIINHGNLRIDAEEGGQLYLNDGASLTNKEGSGIDVWYGTLTVGENGFSAEEGSYVDMNLNYANVVGIEESQLQVHGDVTDATAFHVIMGAGYRGVSLSVMTDVTLECDVTVQEEDWVNMNEGATLTVPAGKTLTVDGGLAINADSAGIVEAGGKLVNNGYISADTGELNVMGTYSGEGTVHMYSVYGQINVSGIPKSSIDATFDYVTDVTTLIHALIAGYQCASVTITGNIVLTESLTVPYGSTLNIADYRTDMVLFARSAILRSIAPKSTCASLTVPEGMTLTVEGNLANNGNMIIEQTAELVNDESGMIENNGSLVVEEAASMVNEGNLYNYGSVVVETSAALVNNGSIETSSGTTLSVSGEYSGTGNVSADITDGTVVEGVDNDAIHMSGEANGEAALREMLSAGYNGGDIYVSGNITLTDDLTIPEGYTVYLNNGAVLNVPDENALTVEGHLQITDAAVVTVEGKLELGENGFLNVQNGELTVGENAECVFDDNIAHISGSGVINGLDKKDLILLAFTQDLDGFKQSMTDAANYGNALVYIEGEIVLTENTVIPQNVQVCLIGSDEAYAGLTIPAEITLTNNGSIEVAVNSNLIIQDQGCIVNNGKLNLGAGSFVVEEGGILEGNGPAEEIVPVAMIGDAEYASVSEALACAVEGDTVVLVADVYEMDLIVREGITLDLNGHTLGAAYIFAVNGANIVDNSEGNTGLVSVEPDCVLISKKNAQLPVWNGEGYVFTTVTYKTRLMEHDNDKLKFAFLPQFKSGATALLEDGVEGNKVTIEVRVSWLTKMGREYRNLVFNEQQVDTVVGTNGAFILTFSGFSQLDMASGITVEGIVISETGVSIASDAIVVDVVSTTE